MAGIRFTDPNKWESPGFMDRSMESKLLYNYLREVCDWGGFLEINLRLIPVHTGLQTEAIEKVINEDEDIILSHDGRWLFIKGFLKLQKNDKLDTDPFSKNVIKCFENNAKHFEGIPEFEEELGAIQGLPRGLGKGKSLSKGKGQGLSNGQGQGEGQETESNNLIIPRVSDGMKESMRKK